MRKVGAGCRGSPDVVGPPIIRGIRASLQSAEQSHSSVRFGEEGWPIIFSLFCSFLPVCSLPPEYCKYGPCPDKCPKWTEEGLAADGNFHASTHCINMCFYLFSDMFIFPCSQSHVFSLSVFLSSHSVSKLTVSEGASKEESDTKEEEKEKKSDDEKAEKKSKKKGVLFILYYLRFRG